MLRSVAHFAAVGATHGDLKPENLMRTKNSVIKVVDFGCARVDYDENDESAGKQPQDDHRAVANTPAYSPPEALKKTKKSAVEPSFDMWSLGVILYIMLTGVHPFDVDGDATDQQIQERIVSGKQPPLDKSSLTAHLSRDAIALIKKLLVKDPRKRMSAQGLLEHPWVLGKTARTSKMADSDKRLSAYRAIKTKLGAKVFADMVAMSDNLNADDVTKKTSLIERSFQKLNPDHLGYVTTKTLRKLTEQNIDASENIQGLSLSGFSDLLAENLQNKYFPKGHVVYKEGDLGNSMFFINSGSVEVYTKDGTKSIRHSGDCFGEGALLNPKKIRSASVRCVTPVHAIQISREYFEKYMATEEGEVVGNSSICILHTDPS